MFAFCRNRLPEYGWIALLSTILAACTTVPSTPSTWQSTEQAPMIPFQADGRLAIKSDGKGSYAAFDWTRQHSQQTININNPLGQRMASLCMDNLGVIAQDNDGHLIQAATAEALSTQLAGAPIPLDSLDQWLLGRYNAHIPHRVVDGVLHQSGWRIRQETREGKPHKLTLTRPNLNIRLIIDHFSPTSGSSESVCPQRAKP